MSYICTSRYKGCTNKMNCELMLTYDTPANMFNVYKNQLSRQTGSRNLTSPKTLPTIWHTYMKLVTKYQIPVINSCLEKCDEKYLGRTEVKQYTPPPKGGGGYNYKEYLKFLNRLYLYNLVWNSLLFSYLKFLNRLYDITWFGLFTFNKRPKPGYIV
jgi:hypothetical protein